MNYGFSLLSRDEHTNEYDRHLAPQKVHMTFPQKYPYCYTVCVTVGTDWLEPWFCGSCSSISSFSHHKACSQKIPACPTLPSRCCLLRHRLGTCTSKILKAVGCSRLCLVRGGTTSCHYTSSAMVLYELEIADTKNGWS